ncbi:MAG: hypothetical protein ACI8Z1_002271 [Candidatus Azotimanducaceae bacterium]|jgi:hypothetical protein
MNNMLKVIVALPAILFMVLGFRWLIDPTGIALEFGFTLADGLGRSSQVGDMFGYFLTLALCILLALVTGQRIWYYPPIMMLSLTAIARVLAWVMHDATLALQMIGVEVVTTIILLAASRRLANDP